MRQSKNWIGEKQGRLTVTDELARGRYSRRYLCQCECGEPVVVHAHGLASGTSSCGCLQRERAASSNRTHGESKTRLYSRWTSMLRRSRSTRECVEVVPEWFNWETFRRFIGDIPRGVQLRRVDSSKPFGPHNIAFVKVAT